MSDSRGPAREEAIGRYRLLCKLGGDEIGFYWLARPSEAGPIDPPKVVFVPRTILLSSALQRSFWEGELHTARRASHPSLLEAGEVVWDEGRLGLVYDYAERISLRRLLEVSRAKPLPERAALRVGYDVAAALHAAHETRDDRADLLHVVHGGVRPESVFVRADGVAMLGHLGVHRAWRSAVAAQGGTARPSPYDAPEVLDGAPATRRSDVYSTGVLLLELGLGALPKDVRSPKPGSSSEERAEAVVRAVASLPEGLGRVVEQCVRPDPGRRFQTALALERALLDAAPVIQHEGLELVVDLVAPALKKERVDLQLRLTSEQHEPPTTEIRRALSRVASKGDGAPASAATDPHLARTRERRAYDPELADEVSTKVYADEDARALEQSAFAALGPDDDDALHDASTSIRPLSARSAPSEPPTRARPRPDVPSPAAPTGQRLADELSERIAALVDDEASAEDTAATTARFAPADSAPLDALATLETGRDALRSDAALPSPALLDEPRRQAFGSDPDDGELAEARAFATGGPELEAVRAHEEAQSIDALLASAPPPPEQVTQGPASLPASAPPPAGDLEAFMRAQMGALLEASRLSAPPRTHATSAAPPPFPAVVASAVPAPAGAESGAPAAAAAPHLGRSGTHTSAGPERPAPASHGQRRAAPPPPTHRAPPAPPATRAPPAAAPAAVLVADELPTARAARRRRRRIVPYLIVLSVALAAGALAVLGLYDPELRRSPRQAPVVDARVDFDAALQALTDAAAFDGDASDDSRADSGLVDATADDRSDGGEPTHDAGHGAKPRGPGAPRAKGPRRR